MWNPQRVIKKFPLVPGEAVVLTQSSNLGLVMYKVCIETGNVNGPVFNLYITEEAFSQTDLSVNPSPADFYLYYFIFCVLLFF